MMLKAMIPAGATDMLSISDQVYAHIKKLILAGTLQAGERIPEKKVADLFEVSRTPVREAIKKLAEYGLVTIKPRSYAYVAAISPEEAKDISWVRLFLEKLSVRRFIAVATGDAFAPLYRLSRQCQDANEKGDYATAHEFDSTLHLAIARTTGNRELLEMLQMLDAKLQLLRLKQHLQHQALSGYFSQHDRLLKLLEQQDVNQLDELLEEHIMHDLNFN
jgi:DNA-binding GntR family transcriptional regulator